MAKNKKVAPPAPKQTTATKAGKRHRYKSGPQRLVSHDLHSIAFWRKQPDVAKCPGCGGFHLVPVQESV